jgi:HlyD family secretion protein
MVRMIRARALLLSTLLLACCGGEEAIQPTDRTVSGPLYAYRGTFQSSMLLTGELEAVEAALIVVPRTPMWRMPIRWMEEDGAVVVAGQRVVELENSQFAGTIEQNRLAEARARNDLMRKEADVEIDLADREQRLEQARVQHEKASIEAAVPLDIQPRRDYQEKQLALSKAEVELQKASDDLEAGREAARAELEELRISLEEAAREVRVAEKAIADLTLRAPQEGIFVISENRFEGRKLEVGDDAWVGLAVGSIPELGEMQVVAQLSDVDDRKVATGMRAICTLDSYPERSYEGELAEIAPVAKGGGRRQSLRRHFRVVVRLHDADPEKMRPGMSVRVEVLPRPRENVLLVPRSALDLGSEAPRALLADGSGVDVELGPCSAYECVVEEGLNEGDELWSGG